MPDRPRRTARARAQLVVAVLLGLALLVGPAAPAQAAEPVGGPALGSPGLVVDPTGAPPLPPLTAASWVVADLGSGEVLAAQDAHGRYAPASTLKTLTALALIPEVDPGTLVTPTFEDVDVEGSKVGIVQTVQYPAYELFAALLMVSGNDAAGALATAAGGMPRATALMNDVAERLQAHDTNAVNTSGLDAEGQTSSAYDLALITRAGLAVPAFRDYVGTRRGSIAAPGGARIETYNHNRLLADYDGALGVKNGYTNAARASFVGAAERDGRTLVVTLMRADPTVWKEAAALLDWGFAAAAAGVEPVGQLVEPEPVEEVEAAAADGPAGLPPAAAAQRTAQDGGIALLPGLALLALGLVLAVAVRRRQVVLRQRARRRAQLRAYR